jgi:hypothetical protein
MSEIVLPFGYLLPMSLHCALGFCSRVGPCYTPGCNCECHRDQETP